MTYAHLLDLADDGSIARGHVYAVEGRVRITSAGPAGVTAVASGTREYDLTLDDEDGSCTCPVGLRGEFCKHLVAAVLLLDGSADGAEPADQDLPPASTKWLDSLDADELREVIRNLAVSPDTAAALDRMATAATGDVSGLGSVVDSIRVRGHLDYRRANRHGQDSHLVVDQLEEMLSPTTADGLLPLIERAVDHLVRAILRSDDSSGVQSGALGRLLDLHVEAARLGSPDPTKLARWMVKVGFAEDGWLDVDPVPYAEPLGERGLATYRREVEKRLKKDPDDFHVGLARERLAVLDADVPAIVDLVGGPLDRPYRFAKLVDALLEIGADDEALEYAVRGVTVSPVAHHTIPLYDTAVRLLRERGREGEALGMRRQQIAQFPTETSYGSLRRAAEEVGDWEVERLAALDVLLERNPRAWLITLLGEDEVELAWGASRSMELDPSLALMLLRARAKTDPQDVFDGYVALIDHTLGPADRQAYAQGVAHLGELRRVAVASGKTAEYEAVIDRLLEEHKRRPTLVAMLRRLPPPADPTSSSRSCG